MIPEGCSIRNFFFHSLHGTFDLFAWLTNMCCFKLFLNENLFPQTSHHMVCSPLWIFLKLKTFYHSNKSQFISSYKYFLWWNLNPHFLLNALSRIIRSWAPPLCIIWGLSRFLLLLHVPHLSFRYFVVTKSSVSS